MAYGKEMLMTSVEFTKNNGGAAGDSARPFEIEVRLHKVSRANAWVHAARTRMTVGP